MSRSGDLQRHYEVVWGVTSIECPFTKGRVDELSLDFEVRRFPPHRERPMWTYATCGMSQPDDAKGIELHIFSPVESDAIVELLYAVAHFHRTGARLDLGHTVNFGRPWLDASASNYGLISLPYLDGPDLELMRHVEGEIRCYWLIPVTADEIAFKKGRGLEALETLFEDKGLDYVNPARASLV